MQGLQGALKIFNEKNMDAVFSASLVGMMLGSMVFGVLGDKLGRKRVIVQGGVRPANIAISSPFWN